MLLCKGKQCRYKKTCQRYLLGLGRTQFEGCDEVTEQREQNGACSSSAESRRNPTVGQKWIDHCLHTSKYVKVEQPPKKSDYPRGC